MWTFFFAYYSALNRLGFGVGFVRSWHDPESRDIISLRKSLEFGCFAKKAVKSRLTKREVTIRRLFFVPSSLILGEVIRFPDYHL